MFRFFFVAAFFLIPFYCVSLNISHLSYIEKFKPGDQQQVKINLINDTDHAEVVNLKLCDYSYNAAGEHFYTEPSHLSRSNASWIHLNTTRINLYPKEKRDFFFTIKVPQIPDLKGSYWSVILVEPADPVNTINSSSDGFKLMIKIRFAYHIITTINGGNAGVEIENQLIQEIDGKKYLGMDIKNTGNFFLNPKMIIKLFNQTGKLENTLKSQNERLYPGNTKRYLFNVQELNKDKYKAFLLLDNEDEHLFGENVEISLN